MRNAYEMNKKNLLSRSVTRKIIRETAERNGKELITLPT